MKSLLWKFSFRAIRMRPGRSTLTLLSVVIGVAAVVSVSIGTATTRRAYRETFAAVAGRAQLEVVAAGGKNFDADVFKSVRKVPGVKAASPVLGHPTKMFINGREVATQVLGIDPREDGPVRDLEVVQKGNRSTKQNPQSVFKNPENVLLEAGLAESLGVSVGQKIKLRIPSAQRKFHQKMYVGGLAETRGNIAQRLTGVIFMRLDVAQVLFADGERKLSAIQVVLKDDADLNTVRDAIAAMLPPGMRVRLPATRSDQMEEILMSTETGLSLATAFSLLLAAFIILNVFLMSVGERRRPFAIMRAVGATRRQIGWLLLRESLAMGTLGTALGVAAGLGGASVLTQAMSRALQVTLPSMILTPMPFVWASLFGFGLSFIGSAIPAWRASRLTPMEALGAVAPGDMEGVSRPMIGLGVLTTAIASGFLAGVITGRLPLDFGVWSGVCFLLGLVMLLPAALEPLTHLAGWFLHWGFRVETRLAQRQVLRHRARSTLTIGVLFLAISTGTGLASAILDNVRDVRDWRRVALSADFFVRPMTVEANGSQTPGLPEELDAEIRKVPGIRGLDTTRRVEANVAGRPVTVAAREFVSPDALYLNLEKADKETVYKRLHAGEMVMGTVLAQRTKLQAGDMVTLETNEGPKEVRIAALSNEYLAGGVIVYLQRKTAQQLLGVEGVDLYIVQAEKGKQAAVHKKLSALALKYQVLANSTADIINVVDNIILGIEGALWGVLVLGFVVAAFGVVNTLTMNVLEQTRELGLLRIVAMTRRQVRRTILVQAMIIGLIGLLPGVLAGTGVAYLMYLGTQPTTGHAIQFLFRPELLAASLAGALAIVIISALIPAERAARLDLVEALHYQ